MSRSKLALSFVAAVALAGCGPSLKTPEDAARALTDKKMKRAPEQFERLIDQLEWELDCDERELEWWADRGSRRDEVDSKRAQLEFIKDNLSKIKSEMMYDVVDIQKGPGDKGKLVEVNIWSYEPKEVAKGSRMYYLKFGPDKDRCHLVEVDKKWKIANK